VEQDEILENSTFEDSTRYFRQVILPEVGEEGQKKLSSARVLVVGTGGLGSPALYYLAAAGVGRLGILDHDTVEITNLQRQILHSEKDLGRPKTSSAVEKLRSLNSTLTYEVYDEKLDETSAPRILPGYDLVIGAVDNVESRRIINTVCYRWSIPWIEGAVKGFIGMVTLFQPPYGPCYECIFGKGREQKDEPVALLGALAGVIGSLQAMEALKFLLDIGTTLRGRVLVYDALEGRFDQMEPLQNPACSICMNPGTVE
jgi:adenylyltransferase/sulfurtransferase